MTCYSIHSRARSLAARATLLTLVVLLAAAAASTAHAAAAAVVDAERPRDDRIVVFSNIGGDIILFKTQLILSGLAEVVPERRGAAAAAAAVPRAVDGTNSSSSATTEIPAAAAAAEAFNRAELQASSLVEVIQRQVITTAPAKGNRRAIASRRLAALARLSGLTPTARLRLTDRCTNTAVVLLGNSVGSRPHSHEVLDLVAALQREAVETKVNCAFRLLLGEAELAYLTGDFSFLNHTGPVTAFSSSNTNTTNSNTTAAMGTVGADESRELRDRRRVLAVFEGGGVGRPAGLKDAYDPYGYYGRFLLNSDGVVLRSGNVVLSSGDLTPAHARRAAAETNAAFLEAFKVFYDQRQGGGPDAGDFVARTLRSPVMDRSVITAAAVAGDCAPLMAALAALSAAEKATVDTMVVAGDRATALAAAAAAGGGAQPPPLWAPVSALCNGRLLVVSGGERPGGALAALHLSRPAATTGSGRRYAAASTLPLGRELRAVFHPHRAPVMPPQWARTTGTAGTAGRLAEPLALDGAAGKGAAAAATADRPVAPPPPVVSAAVPSPEGAAQGEAAAGGPAEKTAPPPGASVKAGRRVALELRMRRERRQVRRSALRTGLTILCSIAAALFAVVGCAFHHHRRAKRLGVEVVFKGPSKSE